ncbi:hypothetical protein RJ640_003855 [Escallonia rubra]|uniref:Large ribosomal subunit protein bL32m n=1 Tax=Escallonia rubra TaxID=112253 RepID=A0AA88QVE3_9ASTE|nr:hypothetical protein RJ640_003855 [Escallonia rubra]
MALRMAIQRSAQGNIGCTLGLRRWNHTIAQPAPFDSLMSHIAIAPQLVLPEIDERSEASNSAIGFEFPSFPFGGGSMELMAVPKKKTTPHKKGIRNGPKALKPTPVIIRCKVCGRVKLPHFFCCSGIRDTDEQKGPTN